MLRHPIEVAEAGKIPPVREETVSREAPVRGLTYAAWRATEDPTRSPEFAARTFRVSLSTTGRADRITLEDSRRFRHSETDRGVWAYDFV